MKLLLSIFIGIFVTTPSLITLLIYTKKRRITWLYSGLFLSLIISIALFFTILEIKIPNNNFNEKQFKKTYSEIIELKFPNSADILEKEFRKDSGLFGHQYWNTKINYDEKDYMSLLKHLKNTNDLLLQDYSANPKFDCKTNDNIIYSIKTRYMNPWNYEIDFFENRKTVRMKLTIYGD